MSYFFVVSVNQVLLLNGANQAPQFQSMCIFYLNLLKLAKKAIKTNNNSNNIFIIIAPALEYSLDSNQLNFAIKMLSVQKKTFLIFANLSLSFFPFLFLSLFSFFLFSAAF